MRLVYADEAGISNPKQEPFVVVVSIIVHADKQLTAVERHLDRLVQRHIPIEHQAEFVFHAKELFLGGKVIKRYDPDWPDEKRFAIGDDLAAIPKRFNLPVAFSWVERAKFPQTFEMPPSATEEDRVIACHAGAFMTSAMMVEHWLRTNAPDEICMMIVEDNQRARRFVTETLRFHQDRGKDWPLDPSIRKHFPFRKIKHDPLFEPKRKSSVLQVADFCAYVLKRFLMNDRRYDRYAEKIWPQVVQLEETETSVKALRA